VAIASHPLGSRLLAELDDVVAHSRVGGAAKLDARRAAARLSIMIVERDLGDHLLGLTLDDKKVLVHPRLAGARRAFVVAHEIAHVLRRRGLFRSVSRDDEEWFADWFARELVLPRSTARQPWRETQLAALHVTFETVALQLSVLREAPALMRYRDRVLCRACGTVPRHPGCECAAWRRQSATARAELPDAAAWLRRRATPDRGVDAQLTINGARWAVQLKSQPATGRDGNLGGGRQAARAWTVAGVHPRPNPCGFAVFAAPSSLFI
jgi:hypothetical protein